MEGTASSAVNSNGIILLTDTFFSLASGCLAYCLTHGTSWCSLISSLTLVFFPQSQKLHSAQYRAQVWPSPCSKSYTFFRVEKLLCIYSSHSCLGNKQPEKTLTLFTYIISTTQWPDLSVPEAISLTPPTAQTHPELSCNEKFIPST